MLRNQVQQCSKNASTQMTSIGCYVSNIEDKLITPSGIYMTADEYHTKRLKAVRVSSLEENVSDGYCNVGEMTVNVFFRSLHYRRISDAGWPSVSRTA